MELVVQHPRNEAESDHGPASAALSSVSALKLFVESDGRDRDLGAVVVTQDRIVDREIDRVHHDLVDAFVHLDDGADRARERRRLQVGLEDQVVSGRDDGAGKPVTILHGPEAYRAATAEVDAFRGIVPREREPVRPCSGGCSDRTHANVTKRRRHRPPTWSSGS